jgi:histidyl-tRNA synthetase
MFQAPRGTTDVLPVEQRLWRYFRARSEEAASRFGYRRIETPIFEDARLFVRGIGEVTDIVEKETYTFEDRGGDLVTLRPEGTAPVCRAYLQHGMHNLPQPVRLYYTGPFFRYDRPQAGRYRQLHQFGVEAIGEADESIDSEVIELAWLLLESVGIGRVSLMLNSIGDPECRPGYIHRLQSYYRSRLDELGHEDCKRRLENNPLRLLDCKNGSCQPLIAEAPGSVDSLCDACAEHWHGLLEHLGTVSVPYQIEKRLVRGLDYYSRTVFEIVPPGEGQQSTIVAGGRYDGLMEVLGGRPTPGIGFGMGIERVLAYLTSPDEPEDTGTKLLVAHMGKAPKTAALALCSDLRRGGVTAVLAPSGRSLRSQLRYASAIDATHAVIIGDRELEKRVVVLRDLARSEQQEVSADALLSMFETC